MSRPADTLDLFAIASGWWGRAIDDVPRASGRVTLTPLQSVGTHALTRMVRRSGGALLADATGLGKSHMAVAVADQLGRRPLVVAPAHLRSVWSTRAPDAVAIMSHAALSRAGDRVDPAVVPSDALIIVDEAHRFRTPTTRRYAALAKLVLRAPVLLVTATPIVSSADDLRALLTIFLPTSMVPTDETGLAAVASLRVVRRTRSDVHADGSGHLSWRERVLLPPVSVTVPDDVIEQTEAAARAAMPLRGEPAKLFASTLIGRLVSSPAAARRSVMRAHNYLVRVDEAARAGRRLDRRSFVRGFGLDPVTQVAQIVMPFWYPTGPSVSRIPASTLDTLKALDARLADMAVQMDPRICRMMELIEQGARVVAFTSFVDTALALANRLGSRIPVVVLTGRGARIGGTRASLAEGVLTFREAASRGPVLALVTPVVDEGIDLECADVAVHLDLPWTPAVIAQREGRLDRPGARRPMKILTCLPDPALDARIGRVRRLAARADLVRRLSPESHGRAAADRWEAAAASGLSTAVDDLGVGSSSAHSFAESSPRAASSRALGRPPRALELGARWWRRGNASVAGLAQDWRDTTRVVAGLAAPVALGWCGEQVVWAARYAANGWCITLPDRALVALAWPARAAVCVDGDPRRSAVATRLWRAWDIASGAAQPDASIARWTRIAAREVALRLARADLSGAATLRDTVLPALRVRRTAGSLAAVAAADDVRAAARVPPGPPRTAHESPRGVTWLLPAADWMPAESAPVRAQSVCDASSPVTDSS